MAFTRPPDNMVPDPIPETLWQVQGGCLWPVGQITCRHERDLEAYR
jgi:hypothetical protein